MWLLSRLHHITIVLLQPPSYTKMGYDLDPVKMTIFASLSAEYCDTGTGGGECLSDDGVEVCACD